VHRDGPIALLIEEPRDRRDLAVDVLEHRGLAHRLQQRRVGRELGVRGVAHAALRERVGAHPRVVDHAVEVGGDLFAAVVRAVRHRLQRFDLDHDHVGVRVLARDHASHSAGGLFRAEAVDALLHGRPRRQPLGAFGRLGGDGRVRRILAARERGDLVRAEAAAPCDRDAVHRRRYASDDPHLDHGENQRHRAHRSEQLAALGAGGLERRQVRRPQQQQRDVQDVEQLDRHHEVDDDIRHRSDLAGCLQHAGIDHLIERSDVDQVGPHQEDEPRVHRQGDQWPAASGEDVHDAQKQHRGRHLEQDTHGYVGRAKREITGQDRLGDGEDQKGQNEVVAALESHQLQLSRAIFPWRTLSGMSMG